MVTAFTLPNLADGKWYFALTAFDAVGNLESVRTPELNKVLKSGIAPPTLFIIKNIVIHSTAAGGLTISGTVETK